jgi:hypothetical protein
MTFNIKYITFGIQFEIWHHENNKHKKVSLKMED